MRKFISIDVFQVASNIDANYPFGHPEKDKKQLDTAREKTFAQFNNQRYIMKRKIIQGKTLDQIG